MLTVRQRAATKVLNAARGKNEYETTASKSDRQPCTTPGSAEYTQRWHALLETKKKLKIKNFEITCVYQNTQNHFNIYFASYKIV